MSKEQGTKKKEMSSYKEQVSKSLATSLNEFLDETDRAAVVLGVAYLDNVMIQIIKKLLIPSTSLKDEFLEGDRAPLGTLSARIQFLFRVGLIDEETFSACNIVRKIRNDFAHSTSAKSLEIGPHADRVRALIGIMKDKIAFKESKKITLENHNNLSAAFRAVIAVLLVQFTFFSEDVEKIKLPKQFSLSTIL